MKEKLAEIGRLFKLEGNILSFEQMTAGNINTTYRVHYDNNKSYIFQKVNVSVFKDPIGVMHNIDKVTSYIRDEYPDSLSVHYHHTVYGDNFIIFSGEFWRILRDFNSITLDSCNSLEEIQSIGEAFGDFQRKLASFDGNSLVETIKDFHNTKLRLETLIEYANKYNVKMPEIEYIKSVQNEASKIAQLYIDGLIPHRPCHNDTKANNVLLDKITHKPLVVIDLDTIMPGTGLYDYADGVRFICSTAKEDEPNLNKVEIDLEKFRAFSNGFLSKVKDAWTPLELENLVLSVFSITIELASRFLLDYISGNNYFKINYPKHNLDRARCQIKLAQSIYENKDKLQEIVDSIL